MPNITNWNPNKTRAEMIYDELKLYVEAKKYLASNYTTPKTRKEALELCSQFEENAPVYVAELIFFMEDSVNSDRDDAALHFLASFIKESYIKD